MVWYQNLEKSQCDTINVNREQAGVIMECSGLSSVKEAIVCGERRYTLLISGIPFW